MKHKEIVNLAKKIIQQEEILNSPTSTDKQKRRAEEEIMRLCSQTSSLEDMQAVDDWIANHVS